MKECMSPSPHFDDFRDIDLTTKKQKTDTSEAKVEPKPANEFQSLSDALSPEFIDHIT